MTFIQKIKCLLGFHKWQKYGGPTNVGGGKFKQTYVCERCKKMKVKVS